MKTEEIEQELREMAFNPIYKPAYREKYLAAADIVAKHDELERENAELRGKLAQVHKDLGCELMDPNGTIWQHAAKVQEENKELRGKLAGMEEEKARLKFYEYTNTKN